MPQKSQTLITSGYTGEQLQSFAYGTFEQLKWNIKYSGDSIIIGYTPKKWNRFENEITVETKDGQITVTSKMINGEAFDLGGRTSKDVAAFMTAFETTKKTATEEQQKEWSQKLEVLNGETLVAAQEEIKTANEVEKVMNLSTGNQYATYVIMGINVAVFALMVISGVSLFEPLTLDIVKWGGNFPMLTFGGEWWRLVSCMFVHIGLLHILLNMYALYSVSVYLEPMLGKLRYIAAYVCSGLISSLISVWWNKEAGITSAGASGAIFGMYGVFLALLTTNIIPKQIKNSMLSGILIFVGYNVFYGLKPNSGIDNAAHIGGLVSGMVIGYIYYFTFKDPADSKTQRITGFIGLGSLLLLFGVLRNEKTPPVKVDYKTGEIYYVDGNPPPVEKKSGKYDEKLEEFARLETLALTPDNDSTLTSQAAIDQYRTVSLPAWEKADGVVDDLTDIASSPTERERIAILKKYVALRVKLTNLYIKRLEQDDDATQQEIASTVEAINDLFK